MLLDPTRETTDPGFQFHVFVTSNRLKENARGSVMLPPVFVLVATISMALLSEPTADLAINLMEFMTDGAAMPELPERPPQSEVGANFLLVKPLTGVSQFLEGVAEIA